MREGYYRTATNNVIINNSLHPHVWYPESGDVFKNNIVLGAYRPAAMNRALTAKDKWGAVLDLNLFATHENDRLKFAQNDCDANSLVGDPLFVAAATMNYQVKENAPAFKIGFRNFQMNEFGVYSERLKRIAKTPKIPMIANSRNAESGKIHSIKDAKLKNIETLGEQSAAGLSSIAGVAIIEMTPNSLWAKYGFQVGDVILKCGSHDIYNFNQLMHEFEIHKGEELILTVMHNQKKKELSFKY